MLPVWLLSSFPGNDIFDGLKGYGADFINFLSQPHVIAVIAAWAITFTVVVSVILTLGFGPIGIGAGTRSIFYPVGTNIKVPDDD
ncbi:uncharacterized protein DNG_00826 [Cephalotrichum gorgonifer]|uniref:Uncharacterized protein n=1 Tax=Cephalotrichum gorgonifer TaxID=2041049 RepID=A0AAE8MPW0_9PEZI|nr:uncharacterized protein DNG_00826 [Cephalotrichum gorgonifer]